MPYVHKKKKEEKKTKSLAIKFLVQVEKIRTIHKFLVILSVNNQPFNPIVSLVDTIIVIKLT